jgi:ferritin-like metal-binding protein YciE
MGEVDHVNLIEQTLQEEKQADEKLTRLAEEINAQARRLESTGQKGSKQAA